MFRDAFVLQYVSPEALRDEIHRFDKAPPPDNPEALTGLLSPKHFLSQGEWLTCEDVRVTSYRNWDETLNTITENPVGTITTPMEYIETWGFWYVPVHVAIEFERTWHGILTSARVSVATLGHEFDPAKSINASGKFSNETVEGLRFATGWGLHILHERQVKPLEIRQVGMTACNGFDIWNFEAS